MMVLTLQNLFWLKVQIMEARVSPCGICGGQYSTGTGFSVSSLVFPLISLHHGPPYKYITWEMTKRPTGGRSSDTSYHPNYMNKGNKVM
jgi:hypothetical protein